MVRHKGCGGKVRAERLNGNLYCRRCFEKIASKDDIIWSPFENATILRFEYQRVLRGDNDGEDV